MAKRACPRRQHWKAWDVDNDYRLLATPACGSLTCPVCVEVEAWKWGVQIGWVAPSRYAVLTGLHDDWQANRAAIKHLFKITDRAGYHLRAVYSIEHNPANTGHHLNLWWWGPDVPQAFLSEAAVRVGWKPVAEVKRWRSRSCDRYGLKEVLYGVKEALQGGSEAYYSQTHVTGPVARFLANNGGRLMHARTGNNSFWRAGVGGPVYSSKKEHWRAYAESRWGSLEDREVVITCRGDFVGSRPALAGVNVTGTWSSASETLPDQTGTSMSVQPPLNGL